MQDFVLRTAVSLQNLAARMREDEEGQAVVEYGGILAVIAIIVIAVFGSGIDDTIKEGIENSVGKILSGKEGGGGGD